MRQLARSIAAGTVSGIATFAASVFAMGYTSALAMPINWPFVVWEVVVVFGCGAFLVALLVHALAVRVASATVTVAMVAFSVSILIVAQASGFLGPSYTIVPAWLAGAVVGSVFASWLRSNNSFKPKPLRGTA